jgi:hypothetical protein
LSVRPTTQSGHFSFDSSIIPVGGGGLFTTGLLDDLALTWNGVTYDASTANTGDLQFDAAGRRACDGAGTRVAGVGGLLSRRADDSSSTPPLLVNASSLPNDRP